MNSGPVNIIFGMKIRQARLEAGLTLTELAAATGLSASYLTEIEKGRKHPRADKILLLAHALGKDYDDLVSIKLSPSLAYLESALASPLLQEFPYEEFGLDESHLVELMTRTPDRASALLHAILEIGRQYDLTEEHFFRAMLRSYQEIHQNYFPEVEEAAQEFAVENELDTTLPVTLDKLTELIREGFGYEIDKEVLVQDEALAGYRSVTVMEPQPKLFVNNALRPRQIKFLLAREIGYCFMGLEERSFMSTPDRADSFQQVLNDFKASYFGGALIMPRAAIVDDIGAFFDQESWQPQGLLALLARYEVTTEMLLYRLSEVIPQFFDLKLHFLRMHRTDGRMRLYKRLNLDQLPLPVGLALYEHYCRRWLTTRLLRELDQHEASWDQPLVGIQLSEFHESDDRFLSFGFARRLVMAPEVTSSVVLGFRDEPNIEQSIRFAHDPAIPLTIINETCERCPLTAEQCTVRVAEPTVLREELKMAQRQAALSQLLG